MLLRTHCVKDRTNNQRKTFTYYIRDKFPRSVMHTSGRSLLLRLRYKCFLSWNFCVFKFNHFVKVEMTSDKKKKNTTQILRSIISTTESHFGTSKEIFRMFKNILQQKKKKKDFYGNVSRTENNVKYLGIYTFLWGRLLFRSRYLFFFLDDFRFCQRYLWEPLVCLWLYFWSLCENNIWPFFINWLYCRD